MALPLILSFLGSGMAGAGMLGAMSPLLAGAIGSGLGGYLQTGNLEDGLKSGLGSYMGGKLLGGMGGKGGAGTSNAAVSGPLASSPTPIARPADLASGGGGGITGIWNNMPSGMTAMNDAVTGSGSFMQNLGGAMAAPMSTMSKAGIGTMLGAALSDPGQPQSKKGADKKDIPQATPLNRRYVGAPEGYQHGGSEHVYFDPVNPYYNRPGYTPYKMGGTVKLYGGGVVGLMPPAQAMQQPTPLPPMKMAEGGQMEMADPSKVSDKDIVSGAIKAVRGELPEQEAALYLAMFKRTFGVEKLTKMIDQVSNGDPVTEGDVEGMVEGPGDGMDDLVPAQGMAAGGMPQTQDVLVSDGEYIVPADVVSHLGNGSSDAGGRVLDNMLAAVREARTGTGKQAPQINAKEFMPA